MPAAEERLSLTWAGHSTVLIEAEGMRILTDPLLRSWVGHVRRVDEARGIAGELDAVLISHVHHDHLDLRSLASLRSRRFVVPRGAGRILERRGFEHVIELDEGDQISFCTCAVRATHAEHRARRFPFAREVPSLGYLIETSACVYFAGDTDLFGGMRELAPDLDLALLPVAGWGPRVGPGHLDPRRAAETLPLLRPRVAIPIHWGTYRRWGLPRDEATLREPAERFERLAADLAPDIDVRILVPGEQLELALPPTAVRP
jgi:L-ascorbate metabolism protein UlaG (beta-lactamase superfamily)